MTKINPLLLNFPDQFETERLLICAPRPGDSLTVYEAIRETAEGLQRWIPWGDPLPTPEETEVNIRRSAAKFVTREDLRLALYRKSDGLYIGDSGLHRIDWTIPRFEIGYWVRKSLEGQGYITEAVRGVTAFAFDVLKAERVEIRCDSRNHRSAAVAERVGYTLEACLRNNIRASDGELSDMLVYVKLRGEYDDG